MKDFSKKEIIKKSESLSDWYNDVILKAELADYAPVKGCMVIRPYGFSLWEGIQNFLDKLFKEKGVKNAYFPIFIPEKYLNLEKQHVKGFAPHTAVVTEAGGEKLQERLVIRPTSETVMYQLYKEWTHSWRDLPILINQWNNVVRWEKRTYLFLRTSEFLWQEGHCAHLTHQESMEMVLWALCVYQKTYQELLAMDGIVGVKSESEKFAGAQKTYSFEMLMPDGKALQSCTSHDLGQNFAKAFNWTVQDEKGDNVFPYQNSWGLSTRSIGGLIMVCGDDHGLSFPPMIAPIQVVIIPISQTNAIAQYCAEIKKNLTADKIRVEVDQNVLDSVGRRFNYWELKGVPLRFEIGEKEVTDGYVTVVRRDNFVKERVKLDNLPSRTKLLLTQMQQVAFQKHQRFTQENTHQVASFAEFTDIMKSKRGFIKAFWCEEEKCEDKIKQETKASTRCLPLDAKKEKGKCIYCGKEAAHRWYFAQAY